MIAAYVHHGPSALDLIALAVIGLALALSPLFRRKR